MDGPIQLIQAILVVLSVVMNIYLFFDMRELARDVNARIDRVAAGIARAEIQAPVTSAPSPVARPAIDDGTSMPAPPPRASAPKDDGTGHRATAPDPSRPPPRFAPGPEHVPPPKAGPFTPAEVKAMNRKRTLPQNGFIPARPADSGADPDSEHTKH